MADKQSFAVAVRVPCFGFDWGEACYYGWRCSIQIGWWLVFFWPIRRENQEEETPIEF